MLNGMQFQVFSNFITVDSCLLEKNNHQPDTLVFHLQPYVKGNCIMPVSEEKVWSNLPCRPYHIITQKMCIELKSH